MNRNKFIFVMIAVTVMFSAIPGFKFIADAITKEKAYQLTVDGRKWVTVSEKEPLESLLKKYQQHYLENIDKHARVKSMAFSEKVDIVEVEVSPEAIDSLKKAREKIYAIEEEAVWISVEKGDSFWSISKDHHVTVEKLEILNPDVDPDKIYPGEKLVVKPINPRLDVVIQVENTIAEAIPFGHEYRKDNGLYKNWKQTVREGVEGQKVVDYHITLLNGYQRELRITKETILKKPVNAVIHVGTKTTVSRGGRINYGVVSGKRVSSFYGTRIHPITGRSRFHSGLDIAAPNGNRVYAYSGGTVVQAGWNGGYGIAVLIDHGNGVKTRYAHLSKINVRIGEQVETADRIGTVGSTGNSTGPHLHFEVIKNGETRNPLNYI